MSITSNSQWYLSLSGSLLFKYSKPQRKYTVNKILLLENSVAKKASYIGGVFDLYIEMKFIRVSFRYISILGFVILLVFP